MKFLSLCIPTYNRPHTLRTIFTVLSACSEKTKRKVEVVIADNSTNDETTKLCGSYSRTIDIRYHKNRKNIGAHKNLQRVTSLAAGEYVWLFGDDDTFSVHTFENVLKRLERHLPDVYLVDRMLYHEDGRTVYEKPYQSYFPNGFNGTMQELLTVLSPLFAFGCISCNIFRRKNARLREFARYRTFRCSHSHVGFIVANFWNGQKVLVDVKNSIQTVVTQRESGYEHVAADESIDTSELLKRITDIAVHDPETIINIQAKAGLDRREARRQLLFHQRVEKRKKSGVVNDSFASVGTGNLPPIVKESENHGQTTDALLRRDLKGMVQSVVLSRSYFFDREPSVVCDAFLPKIIALHDEKPSKSEPYIFLAINIPRMYREFFRKGYLKPSQLNASTSLNFSNGVKIYTFFLALSFLATFPEKEKIRRSQARFIRLYYRRYSPLVLRPVVIPLVRYFTRRRRTTPKTHQSASLRWLTAIIPLFKDLFKIFFNKKANE